MHYLDENLSNGDKRSAELCDEQAADEEVPQSSSEELQIKHLVASQLEHTKRKRLLSVLTRVMGMKMRSKAI